MKKNTRVMLCIFSGVCLGFVVNQQSWGDPAPGVPAATTERSGASQTGPDKLKSQHDSAVVNQDSTMVQAKLVLEQKDKLPAAKQPQDSTMVQAKLALEQKDKLPAAQQPIAKKPAVSVPTDYNELKSQYEAVVADRDNIIAQTKLVLEQKDKFQDAQTQINVKTEEGQKIKQEAEAQLKEKDAAAKKLQDELNARLDQNTLLQQKVDELQQAQAQTVRENENLKNSLEKLQIEYKIIPDTKKTISRLTEENTSLAREVKNSQNKFRQLEDQKLDAYAQVETYRRQVLDFRKRYEGALAKNREFEKKIASVPSRFAEMARENKVLIKETALMHYNLGVFYTQSKEYSRAIAEFEKAIELNPEDPYAFYNLGYIYAEYVVNRPKAIDCFRHFMKLAKAEDSDLDWVKKYILTWQTWEGKKPME